jgi:hypothetical protein
VQRRRKKFGLRPGRAKAGKSEDDYTCDARACDEFSCIQGRVKV